MDRPVEDSGEVLDIMVTKMPEVVERDPARALRPSHLDPFYGINCVGWIELVRKINKFYMMQMLTNLPVQSGWGIALCLLVVVLTALNHLSIGIIASKGVFFFLTPFFSFSLLAGLCRGSADLMVHLHCLLVPPCQSYLKDISPLKINRQLSRTIDSKGIVPPPMCQSR